MSFSRQAIGRAVGLAGCLAALAIYGVWQVLHRGAYQYSTAVYQFDDADEWRYTACSRLVEHGYRLFDQVFSAQPPVLFLALAGSMRAFGDSIAGARWSMILFGLIALAATAWITWMLAGPVGAGIAAVLLAVSPGFLVYSRAVEAEIPMMALVTTSLALALASRRRDSPILPLLAGLVLAAAILTKLFAVETLAPAVWVLLSSSTSRPRWWPAALYCVAALIPVALEMALISPSDQWAQVVTMHSRAAGISLPGAPSALVVLRDFFGLDLGLTLLAVGGLAALALLAVWEDFIFLLLWLGGSALMLLLFRPLFPHHPIILLSAMATAAGIAGTVLIEQVRSRRWLAAAPLLLLGLAYVGLGPRLAHADRLALFAGISPSRATMARFVAERSRPTDMVAVDDLALADLSHRLVPPGLCDPSNVRLRAGYLSAAELIRQTREYRARVVLPTLGIYVQVPTYLRWVGSSYRRVKAPLGLEAYLRR